MLVGHTSDEQWDATNGELRYTVTDRYRHDRPGGRGTPDHRRRARRRHGCGTGGARRRGRAAGRLRRRQPTAASPVSTATAAPAAHGGHPQETVRTAHYRGHAIEIRTSYQVTIDGEPLRPT